MRSIRLGLVFALTALIISGCGDGRLTPKGRVIRNGEPFKLGEGEGLRIVFAPAEAGAKTYDSYMATYKDGSFEVKGKDGKGLPPGKYRVGLEHYKNKEDLFQGAYSPAKTPFVIEVTDDSKEIVIDLDHPIQAGP